MFDIGFFELMVIGILALLVLGPERLPKAARTAGLWIGRIKQSFSSIQQEVNQQLHLEEMQRQLEDNRRKLEDTLRKQEQSITQVSPTEETNTSNVSGNAETNHSAMSANSTVNDTGVAAETNSAAQASTDKLQDEGPFGTTEPERKS